MLNAEIFAQKLKKHRHRLGLTQEEVADRVGVSPQAVSKWEAGDCLPDLYNLEALSRVYNLSPDILLNTESEPDIQTIANRIEQMAIEAIWKRANQPYEEPQSYLVRELGEDLLTLWRGIYFVENGNLELAAREKERGNMRVISPFGLKVWDDDGVVCVVKSDLAERIATEAPIGASESDLLQALASSDGLSLISLFRPGTPLSKDDLVQKSGLSLPRLNELLLQLCEGLILTHDIYGYRLSGHMGIAAYMVMAAGYLLTKKQYTVSEFVSQP